MPCMPENSFAGRATEYSLVIQRLLYPLYQGVLKKVFCLLG